MKKVIIKIFFLSTILIISFIYTIKWLDTININLDSNTLDILIANSNNKNKENLIINTIVQSITKNDYLSPVTIMLNKYKSSNKVLTTNKNEIEVIKPIKPIKEEPTVYIYNTHQTEKYSVNKEINIALSVLDASYILQQELKKYNISSIVENGSIKDILDTNNWKYASSYKVSRMYLEKAKKNNPTLNYFIDLHRDSANKKVTTITINGKTYARTMFLLGLENTNYKQNEQLLNKLESWLDKNYPGISRGIYKKEGPGVNGIYNQDFSKNTILIEVGGVDNTKEEVANTIEVIAQMLNECIGDQKNAE